MAKLILNLAFIATVFFMFGCTRVPDEGSYFVPPIEEPPAPAPKVMTSKKSEVDIVEQLVANRNAYHQTLELLADYYSRTGNHTKLKWVRRELEGISAVPRYRYIFEAELMGPNLRATQSLPEANMLYNDAVETAKRAREKVFVNAKLLRAALDKFNQLIARYKTSDKIDDAAFRAGEIYEHFKEYPIAAIYYQRAFQWDPETVYPARFKAAYILDKYLKERAKALPLYREAKEKELGKYPQYRNFVEKRIRELSGSTGDEK